MANTQTVQQAFHIHPLQKVLLSFLGLILTGALLLMLPGMAIAQTSFTDALFTATSAVCVTGLITLDTAGHFTLGGKTLILLLIQLGGLGIMTFSLGLLSMLGKNLSLQWRFTFSDLYSGFEAVPARKIIRLILIYTLVIEGIASCILFFAFLPGRSVSAALGHAVFHAVSAFCNAGFSTFSDSLTRFQGNPLVILTISTAVILGGLGFIVLYELVSGPRLKGRRLFSRYTTHSRIILITTAILLLGGTLVFFLLEKSHAMAGLSTSDRLLASFFHSVSCRTAGFNSINISTLRESTLLATMALMFIGGSPGSIAGGIKTTTIAVIFLLLRAKFRGEEDVVIWGRSIEKETIDRSMTLIILAFLFVSLVTFIMLTIKDFDLGHSFISVIFEAVSAFGTVGLSTGITGQLPIAEKYLIAAVMFIGRLGPLTLITALTLRHKKHLIDHPEEQIMIG